MVHEPSAAWAYVLKSRLGTSVRSLLRHMMTPNATDQARQLGGAQGSCS